MLGRYACTIFDVIHPKFLTEEEQKNCRDTKCLRCDYHGLVYRTDGRGNAYEECTSCGFNPYLSERPCPE